jgi:NADH dehydrogenase
MNQTDMTNRSNSEACNTNELICIPDTKWPRVVIIGGGFAGISIAKKLKNKNVQIVLLDKNNFHQFQPLFYQVASSGIDPDSIVFPLRKMFKGYRNVFFRMVQVQYIDAENNWVETNVGAVKFDYLVIATGSDTNFFGLRNVREFSIGMKTIREALDIRSLILQNLEKAVVTCDEREQDYLTNFAIVGGGPAGVETAGALAEFKKYILPEDYPELDVDLMRIYLIEAGPKLLNTMSEQASDNTLKYLEQMGVDVLLNTAVNSYDGLIIKMGNTNNIEAKTLIWTAGVQGNVPAGLNTEIIAKGNRILVDGYSRVKGYENIFAIGDAAAMHSDSYPNGHPMVAQVAIQQGNLLAKNILRNLEQNKPKPFQYNDKGSLATIGKRKAVGEIGRLKFSGFSAWVLWSVVHLISISGFRNKLIVGLNWAWSYFTYDKGNRLIIRKYKKNKKIDTL